MRKAIVGLAWVIATSACGCGAAPTTSSPAPHSTRSTRTTRSTHSTASPPATTPEPPSSGDWRATYRERPALRTMSGAASYYHDSLAGNSTASGEPYDPRQYTAASRDLPFGTVLRVVRQDTGASVIVRVNDRGPFGRRQRLLDLSRAAAEQLDMISRGVIDVRAEVLEDGPTRARSRRRRR